MRAVPQARPGGCVPTESPFVILDCDGVLVDSEPIAARVMAEFVTELGLPMAPNEAVARFTGLSLTTVLGQVSAELGRELPDSIVADLRARDEAAFRSELRAIAGVETILKWLRGRCCVASSGRPEKMRLTLGLTGLLEYVESHLFSATQVARGKPAPDLFWFAAAQMSWNPVHCVVVEDSVAGIRAACAAGMIAIGFAGGGHCGPDHQSVLRAAGATLTLDAMADLPNVLAKLNVRGAINTP